MIFRSPYPDMPAVPFQPTVDAMVEAADRIHSLDPERIAFMDSVDSASRLTVGQLADSIRRVASFLISQGFEYPDVAMVMLPNRVEFTPIMSGIIKAGLVFTALNPAYTKYELDHYMKDSSASVIFTDAEHLPKVIEVASSAIPETLKLIVCLDGQGVLPKGVISYERDLLSTAVDHEGLKAVQILPENIFRILYTSGTSGKPKGVLISHRCIFSALAVAQHMNKCEGLSTAPSTTLPPRKHVLLLFPMFHQAGMGNANIGVPAGFTQIVFRKFHLETVLRHIQEFKITVLKAAPPVFISLAKSPITRRYDLSTLTEVQSLSSAVPASIWPQVVALIPTAKKILNYAMTEVPVMICHPPGGKKKCCDGSVGVLMPNVQLKLVKTDGGESGVNEVGEIAIRTPTMFSGYRNLPEENRASFDEDGFFITGDLGRIDEHGCIFIVDREKDFIKVKGFQVSPSEVESVLHDCEDVAEAAVVGTILGVFELPWAFVVPKSAGASENRIRPFLAGQTFHLDRIIVPERLTSFKLPAGYDFVPSLPYTPTGKIDRKSLKALLAKRNGHNTEAKL